jgi:hypothetical protein
MRRFQPCRPHAMPLALLALLALDEGAPDASAALPGAFMPRHASSSAGVIRPVRLFPEVVVSASAIRIPRDRADAKPGPRREVLPELVADIGAEAVAITPVHVSQAGQYIRHVARSSTRYPPGMVVRPCPEVDIELVWIEMPGSFYLAYPTLPPHGLAVPPSPVNCGVASTAWIHRLRPSATSDASDLPARPGR